MTRLAAAMTCLACAGCAIAPLDPWFPASDTPDGTRDLIVLESFLMGDWTNALQAKENKEFAEVRLRQVPIWTSRAGEHWMYAEQAFPGKEDRPYRQRVYRIVARKGDLLRLEYTLPGDPARFAGEWKKAQPLAALRPEDLELRKGCTVKLQRQMEIFFNGGTQGRDCASDLEGAAYATSEISLTSSTLKTLDRGFDPEGKQVWGSTAGAYDFWKITREVR